MATVEQVRRLDNSHPHTRVATVALRQPLSGIVLRLTTSFSTINPPKQEYDFTPPGGPNMGKNACVISAVLPHARLLFVQHDAPMPNQ